MKAGLRNRGEVELRCRDDRNVISGEDLSPASMGNLSSDWMQRQSSRVQPRLPEYLKTNCVQVVARSNRKRDRAV